MPEETTYHDVRDRYRNDPHFKSLVDAIMSFIVVHKFTPGEVRDAAFMAALNFEQMTIRPRFIRASDLDRELMQG